jgi:hypothetical protein
MVERLVTEKYVKWRWQKIKTKLDATVKLRILRDRSTLDIFNDVHGDFSGDRTVDEAVDLNRLHICLHKQSFTEGWQL